jgi:hypothetical protein
MQALRSRFHLLLVVAALALGFGGVALAQTVMRSSTTLNVTLLDGKLTVSQTTFAPGKLTLVAINEGKRSHGLAIMGTGLKPKLTPTLTSGKTATLSVTVGVGMYHIWDPVSSSMTHATMLMVKKASGGTAGSISGNKTVTGGSAGSSGSSSGSGSGTSTTPTIAGGGGGGGTMPGMNPNDPCAGM